MIEDFIEVNKLKSQIVNFPTETSVESLVSKSIFPKNLIIKTQLFVTKDNITYLTIVPFYEEVNFSKLKLIINDDEFLEANDKECFDITGYYKNFLPPISIYGINLLIDNSLKDKKTLICRINEKQFLKAQMSEIIENNDEVEFVDLI